MTQVTKARYSGHCADCGARYSVGDEIALERGEWVHIECAGNAPADPSKVHQIIEHFHATRTEQP